jgi:HK97 family phage major capsid protein
MDELNDKKETLRGKQVELAKWASNVKTFDKEAREELNKRNDEVNGLKGEIVELEKAAEILNKTKADIEQYEKLEKGFFPGDGRATDRAKKASQEAEKALNLTIGELFVASKGYKDYDHNRKEGPTANFEVKTVFQETTANSGTVGYAPQIIRNGVIVEIPQYKPKMYQVIQQGTTNLNAIMYQQETTNTNGAVFVHEDDGTAGESAFVLQDVTEPVKKVRVTLPVSDDMLEDAPYMMSFINGRLMSQLGRTIDTALISGNGSGDNLQGLLNRSGIQTSTVAALAGAGNNVDALHKAMTQIMVNSQYDPNAAVLHPLNWETILLTKSADGVYLYGDPYTVRPNRIWGIDVVVTQGISQGTALIGAFQDACQQAIRRDITMSISTEHQDNWMKGRVVIKLEARFALIVYRPNALYSLTSLT